MFDQWGPPILIFRFGNLLQLKAKHSQLQQDGKGTLATPKKINSWKEFLIRSIKILNLSCLIAGM